VLSVTCKLHLPRVVMLNVVMLSVVMLSVVMLSVVAPHPDIAEVSNLSLKCHGIYYYSKMFYSILLIQSIYVCTEIS
jgi:hypothetical protein